MSSKNKAKLNSSDDARHEMFGMQLPACKDDDDDQEFQESAQTFCIFIFPARFPFFVRVSKRIGCTVPVRGKVPGRTSLPSTWEKRAAMTIPSLRMPVANVALAGSSHACVVSELQKHRIKFTILLATNPVDQLFLARYLRTSYPQGASS